MHKSRVITKARFGGVALEPARPTRGRLNLSIKYDSFFGGESLCASAA